jgi:hypothetical protein
MAKWLAPYHGASEEFLRSHVATEADGCLPWPYGTDKHGYGFATIDGIQRRASNWMCRLAHGEPFMIWKHAAHSCGNPSCVNPKHLRWASHAENMADKEKHGTVNRGERNGKTTITEADVLAIREAPAKLAPLMARYGLSKYAISKIRSGKRWAHIGGPRSSRQRGTSPQCWNGHPFDEANTRWTSDGYRQCRVCDRERAMERRHGVRFSDEEGV